jgi:hypothetical protein
MNAAIIAGVVSLSITLIMVLVAFILTNRKVHHNFKLEFPAEGGAREMLMGRKWPYPTFRVLKYHLCGFTDDEFKKNPGSSRRHSARGRGTGGLGASLAESRRRAFDWLNR